MVDSLCAISPTAYSMRVFPDDFALQMLQQINDLVSQLFGAILNTVSESIVTSGAGVLGCNYCERVE